MIIGVDFDGTCVAHDFPEVGKSIGAEKVLRKLVAGGHQLILFTMRSGKFLDAAVWWFEEREIPLYGINTNPTQKTWTQSPKAYCNLYIDDAALGCPLKTDQLVSPKPFVNWAKVERLLTSDLLVGHTKTDKVEGA